MDTSEIYVKMCNKAMEIQKIRFTLDRGDFLFNNRTEKVSVLAFNTNHDGDLTWLPRQDQLQEIIGCNPGNWIIWMDKFISDREYFYTLEQTWLAFVMKENWGKEWVNGEWVKK